MKKLLLLGLVLILALSAFALTGCGGDDAVEDDHAVSTDTEETAALDPEVQAIKDRGVLRVGVKSDVPGFGLLNPATNEFEGLEIEMAHALAEEIIGDASAVEFTPVTADTRGTLLDNGQIDMVIATFTIKPERLEQWNFTAPYYTDAVGLLVNKDSGVNSLEDLNGKKIGVALAATSKDAVEAAGAEEGWTFEFVEFNSYPEISTALAAGQIDAFSVDRSILRGYLNTDRVLLDDEFSPQDYGIATKLSNTGLAAYVDQFISDIKSDGRLDEWIKTFNI
ncbi:MAG: transporter substrate-binding domain-containing protein [Coriobacteriia bacterium]|nr:transporter substrate-binding domain-containing protein [Coriobacteriia bacterium]